MEVETKNGWLIIMGIKYGLKRTLIEHLVSFPATVELFFNKFSWISDQVATMENYKTVHFLRCIESSGEKKNITVYFVLSLSLMV